MGLKLRTRVFDVGKEKYVNLTESATAMGISVSQAKPLGLEEVELFTLAEYMSPKLHPDSGDVPRARSLDPYVAGVLSQEPAEIQRAVIVVLSVMKSMAKGMSLTERPMNATSTVERVRRES